MTSDPGHSAIAQDDSLLGRWMRIPLYLRILFALFLGVLVGTGLGALPQRIEAAGRFVPQILAALEIPSKLILRVLGALAPPLILLAVIQALMKVELPKGSAVRLISLLLLNTCVAIVIGLLVANVLQPGKWADLRPSDEQQKALKASPLELMLENIPRSLIGPFGDDGKVIGVILWAVAFGIAMRNPRHREAFGGIIDLALETLVTILHWVIEVIPLAVFGVVAATIGVKGFDAFKALGAFVIAVIVALLLQVVYYLIRIRLGSWVSPLKLLRDMRDPLVMAFSTASSTITMPVTYEALKEKVGLRERSASLGSLVGANFNNDGTALYEAMSALFIAQMLGHHLSLTQQLIVVVTSIVASVGAAGIPEAGLVTMTLVFKAVGLPTDYIVILLTVDWFLDRCRTTVNVLGDVNVSCLLDGHIPQSAEPRPVEVPALDEPVAVAPVTDRSVSST